MFKILVIVALSGQTLTAQTANEITPHPQEDLRKDQPEDEVRFAIKLRPYELVKGQEHKKQVRALEVIHETLRVKVDRPNHFYFGGFHIETRPIALIKKIGKLTLQIHISKRFGSKGQVEEPVGRIELEGMIEEKDGVNVLNAIATLSIKDPSGNLILDVLAGYKPAPRQPSGPSVSLKQ